LLFGAIMGFDGYTSHEKVLFNSVNNAYFCGIRVTSCHYDFVPGDFVPLYWRLRATYIFIEENINENINDSFLMYLNVVFFHLINAYIIII